ncbi:hypothetical protein PIGHUM_00851 [Pigmentiphaga humi]|uniref:Quinol:cytochrome c oxidoreductase quinone-binding subunit 2 n=1 Tax=Pigmentiphaga humi TaxID=2478468 RepID=A0A3P4AXK5_9BURK|nr:hypothetical protein [Pigmentiphaga humi]VCU68793.1 hypothetical protein PIGHUM_00851 [Pigmentiphaga humi]
MSRTGQAGLPALSHALVAARPGVAAAVALATLTVAGAAGAWLAPTDLAAAWLAAWWGWTGAALGSLGVLYIDGLAGGRWSADLRTTLYRRAAMLPLLALLWLPLFPLLDTLYPWAASGWIDPAREPAFREAWRALPAFTFRLLLLGLLWSGLAWFSPGGSRPMRPGAAAAGLLAVGWSATVAAIDLVVSLVPTWHSSGFGLLALVCQLKFALALGTAAVARAVPPQVRGDLGNLLLTFVLGWAYLEFTQFQIIWAENLPHEISWYLPRYLGGWRWLGLALALGGFALPLLLLLSRRIKRSAAGLQWLASWVAAFGMVEAAWQVLPSVPALSWHLAWLLPVLAASMGMLAHAFAAWLRTRQAVRMRRRSTSEHRHG